MSHQTKPIIVSATIANKQRLITMFKDFPLSTTYHVLIDKEHEAEAIRNSNGWKVFPREGSWLKGENCDEIIQAILNIENPNL